MDRRVPIAALAVLVAAPLVAAVIADLTFPDSVAVGGTQLQLNGVGLRKKLWIKVYAGGLYVAQKSADPAALIALESPKRMVMQFIYKEVERAKLDEAWNEGFANNSGAQLPALKSRLERFSSWWPAMRSGDTATITYLPGTGTRLEINGKEMGVIEGADFARALFAVWLGEKPADAGLKAGLLGR